ncbi:hypothetical protein SAMN05446037_104817 [Anaerovirgula multivorans]|uniref:Uncharacterized protein n=1 Tax=Anaerovirgula multivorans TaxID=312168 RepID=A0A239KJV2_9FIRM|nr:hypothetical protein SAMN05446037_104817 [Anaerovirgula multivorans]
MYIVRKNKKAIFLFSIFLALISMLFFLTNNFNTNEQSIIKLINNNEAENTKILYIQKVKRGAIVFSQIPSIENIEINFLAQRFLNWYLVGKGQLIIKDTEYSDWWGFSRNKIGNQSFNICYGAVEATKVKNINIKVLDETSNNVLIHEDNPNTIEVEGKKIWFLDIPTELRFIDVDIKYEVNNEIAMIKIYIIPAP